uniref:Histone acetyltransferase n=1 Tax=Plectus sambesii TaxID=2011161 RepID=A0A914WV17_9BILA
MGLLTYRNYWRDVIFEYLCKLSHGEGEQLSIKDLSAETGIHPNDIVSTLQFHKMMRYYKGKHIILAGAVEKYRKTERHQAAAHRRRIKPDCLQWRPSAHRETVEAA